MKRRYLSAREKAIVIERQKGKCDCGCKEELKLGAIDYDHRLALQFGGTNSLDNFVALVRKHHRAKSDKENTVRAKMDRIKAKHTGTYLNATDREIAKIQERTRYLTPHKP